MITCLFVCEPTPSKRRSPFILRVSPGRPVPPMSGGSRRGTSTERADTESEWTVPTFWDEPPGTVPEGESSAEKVTRGPKGGWVASGRRVSRPVTLVRPTRSGTVSCPDTGGVGPHVRGLGGVGVGYRTVGPGTFGVGGGVYVRPPRTGPPVYGRQNKRPEGLFSNRLLPRGRYKDSG